MAKEKVEEKVAKAMSERDETIKALEVEKADPKVRKEMFKEEAIKDIVKYGVTFRQLALFVIKEKYHDLDFSDINFSDMRGHNERGVFRE